MTHEERLLYVMNHYSSKSATHFSHIIPLLNELSAQGTRIHLLIEKGDCRPSALAASIDCTILPSNLTRFGRLRAVLGWSRREAKAGTRAVFVRISSWSALAAILGTRLTPAKVFYWLSGTTIEFDRKQPWSLNRARWWVSSRAPYLVVKTVVDVFVTGPEPMLEYYQRVGRVKANKLRLLYNDIGVDDFDLSQDARRASKLDLARSLEYPADWRVLLSVHRLSPVRQTLRYLPNALVVARDRGLLTQSVVVFAGAGGDLPALRRMCEEAGLSAHVRFLGDVPASDVRTLYSCADVFLQPSHAEGFPRVLLEAMASGLPIVTTDAGGTASILGTKQQAFIADREVPSDFNDALCAMLSSEDYWPVLAEENLEAVKKFDTPPVASMYREVLFGEK